MDQEAAGEEEDVIHSGGEASDQTHHCLSGRRHAPPA